MRDDSAGEEEEMKIVREHRRDSKELDNGNDDVWGPDEMLSVETQRKKRKLNKSLSFQVH